MTFRLNKMNATSNVGYLADWDVQPDKRRGRAALIHIFMALIQCFTAVEQIDNGLAKEISSGSGHVYYSTINDDLVHENERATIVCIRIPPLKCTGYPISTLEIILARGHLGR